MANENSVKYGLSNVHIAVRTVNAETGAVTYGTPWRLRGAVNFTCSAEGQENPFYADNIKYYKKYNNNGYTGELEVARITEKFKTDILGFLNENGVLVESADATTKDFALGFEIDGDEEKERFWFLNCSCSRPGTDAATNGENIEPKTDKMSISIAANDDKRVKTQSGKDCPSAVYEAWFNAVVTKGTTGNSDDSDKADKSNENPVKKTVSATK